MIRSRLGNAAPALSHNPPCPANFPCVARPDLPHTRVTLPSSASPQAQLHPRPTSRTSPDQDGRAQPGFQAPWTSQGHQRNHCAAWSGHTATCPCPWFGWRQLISRQYCLEFPTEHSAQLPLPLQMLQNKGVKFYMKTELRELKGKDGKVSYAL